MKTSLTAILVAGTLCTPAYAETFIGGSEAGVPQSRPAPPISTPNPDRFRYPDLDPTARRVGDRLCYAFIPIAAPRTQDICIPTQNFADTLDPKPDMISQVFAGNTLDTDVEQLAKCHIRRRDDPGIGTAPTDDPTNGYQFDLRCPSRREGGGHYELSVAFNRDYYLPYRLVDSVCGPDQATVGSQFDQYVRTTLGEPTAVDTRGTSIRQYHWAGTGTNIWLTKNEGGQGACENPTPQQRSWIGRIAISNATWDSFTAYMTGLTQQQRDSSFNRF
ncbi:hypothetical protein [Brevundimonas sp.]|uniref:hypothetical protein n=1 Tax=Brevundimonas sp. TaxID=1871086 RepID=UPI0035651A39